MSKPNVWACALHSLLPSTQNGEEAPYLALRATCSHAADNGLCLPVLLGASKYVDSRVSVDVRGGARALATDFSTHPSFGQIVFFFNPVLCV